MDVQQILAEAERHALAGDVLRADVLVQDVLRRHPEHAEALYMAGMFQSHTGNPVVAEGLLKRAIAADPKFEIAYASLGAVQLKQERFGDAIASLRQAVALDPDFPEAYETLADALNRAGRTAEAADAWRRLTELRPDEPEPYIRLGVALQSLQRHDEAVAHWAAAAERFPQRADFVANYALSLFRVRRIDDAISTAEYAIQLDRKCAAAYFVIHHARVAQRRSEAALAAVERLLDVLPEEPAAHCDRGLALLALGEVDGGIAALERSIRLRPEAYSFASMLLMARQHVVDYDQDALYRQHLNWATRYARGHGGGGGGGGGGGTSRRDQHEAYNRDPERPLRVGFVSGDFRLHPVADFTRAIFEHRDRGRFHVVAYSDLEREDVVTAQFRGLADGWRPIFGRCNDEVEQLIRADRIDVLIDLVGHTTENRLLVFARRPAPVQVTYVGYCDTTGLSEIDYIIGDAITDPPGAHQPYAEQLLHLPANFACYSPPPNAPAVNDLPALSRGDRAITFGSLHKLAKLNEPVIELWSRVLHAVPGSRMLMFRDALSERPRRWLTEMFARHGIDATRLDFRNVLPPSRDPLSIYNDIDISLDSFPWSGHTTACESMWMSVPMVTLRGHTHAARMAASTIVHAGKPQWVAEDQDQFVRIATEVARDLDGLARTRQTLREEMRASRLCDGITFTREFEALLRNVWRTSCERGR